MSTKEPNGDGSYLFELIGDILIDVIVAWVVVATSIYAIQSVIGGYNG